MTSCRSRKVAIVFKWCSLGQGHWRKSRDADINYCVPLSGVAVMGEVSCCNSEDAAADGKVWHKSRGLAVGQEILCYARGAIVCQEKLLEVKRCCCRSGDSSKDKEVMLPFIRRSLFWPGYTVGSLNLLHIDEHHKNLSFCIFSSNHQIMNFLFLSSIVHKFSFTYFVILCRIYDWKA